MRRHQGMRLHQLVPVLATVLMLPLVKDVLFSFLPVNGAAVPVDQWATSLTMVASRLANLVAAAVILHSYSDLVRGPDRDVLDVHPVRAKELVTAIALRTVGSRLYLPVMGAILLSPVAEAGGWLPYFGATALVVSGWLAGLGVGFMVHLGGVWAAYSPALAAVLDALRGDNPRMQAALIYAPGVALALVGVAVEFAAIGLGAALTGWTIGFSWLVIPAGLGLMAWSTVGMLANRFYVKASLLLADVDGAWAQADQVETAGQVYLQRLGSGKPEVLRALRLGWRSLRIYATGAWVTGLIIAIMGWSSPERAVFWGGLATIWVSTVASLMPSKDPAWLDQALGVSAQRIMVSRALVAWAYGLAVVGPVGLVMVVKHDAWVSALGLVALGLIGSVLSAGTARWFRGTAVWAYGAGALVAWAGFVRMLG